MGAKLMKRLIVITLAFALQLPQSGMAEEGKFENDNQKAAYTLGYSLGEQLREKGIVVGPQMDTRILMHGLLDGASGGRALLSEEEQKRVMIRLYREMALSQKQAHDEVAAENLAKARAFFQKNRNQPGVKELPSGLQYRVLEEGSGPSPAPGDVVTFHYKGTLSDGTVFADSYAQQRPLTAPVNKLIPGWRESLPLMRTGARWMLYIPPDLAYGDRAQGPLIPPNSLLIFEMNLIETKVPSS